VQNNVLSTNHSCTKQLIVHTPRLCKTTYCPHTTGVQNNLLSTQHRDLFSTVTAVNTFVDASFCLSFAQLLNSTRNHSKFRGHVILPDIKLYVFLIWFGAQARGHRCLSSRISYIPEWDLCQIYYLQSLNSVCLCIICFSNLRDSYAELDQSYSYIHPEDGELILLRNLNTALPYIAANTSKPGCGINVRINVWNKNKQQQQCFLLHITLQHTFRDFPSAVRTSCGFNPAPYPASKSNTISQDKLVVVWMWPLSSSCI
jgi:hypothetical protein